MLYNCTHLLLCNLHVKNDVVDQLRQSFFHCAFKFVVFQQGMNKFKYAEHKVFKAQYFTWTKNKGKEPDLKMQLEHK